MTETTSKKSKSWKAKVAFSAELHKEERAFSAGEDIPGNVSQTTLEMWEERGLIEEADPKA